MSLAAATLSVGVLGLAIAFGQETETVAPATTDTNVAAGQEVPGDADVPMTVVAASQPASHVPEPPLLKAEYFLALTMYHEARGKSPEAMRAVGWVVLNRTRTDGFPNGIHDVVVEPTRSGKCQFSWACGDLTKNLGEDKAWQQAETLAGDLLFDAGRDPTKGAVWFWESWRERPSWLGRNVRETLELGGHSFYAPTDLS